jgi:ATP-dependent Lon protease
MSSDATDDEPDDFDLPLVDDDVVSTGAAADSSGWDERLKGLPRILRYAMFVGDNADHVRQRLVAEIDELCPNLPLNAAWAPAFDTGMGLALAAELDHRAVTQDEPNLRSFADCVRLLCLPMPSDVSLFEEYRRVGKALLLAFNKVVHGSDDEQLCCDIERFVFGWAALPVCTDLVSKNVRAAPNAAILGLRMAEHRIAAAKDAVRRKAREEEARRQEREAEATRLAQGPGLPAAEAISDHHLVVARLSKDEMKNIKLKEIIGPLKAVINAPLPLVEVPPLQQVRNALIFEFPYAIDVIDFALADLVGRPTIRLRPLLLVGDPGGGKSRFARRLGELLGLSVWREDASRADGAVFAGTDRRWYSAEPCHPLLAVAQGNIANPLVLIDEIEKAGTRADYGRLWDCLLGFLEPETSVRYPDPALQTTLDLSQVSYIATANSLDPLPSPIRDRFRVVAFPKPAVADLDALLPAVMADLARERGVDRRWIVPLDGTELTVVARHWRGGSVRRLRRIVEAILRDRDIRETRN